MIRIRKSSLFFTFIIAVLGCAAYWMGIPSRHDASIASTRLAEGRRLVRELGLTDLCLFSEARYTRHLSQADMLSAFQDHPGSLEHFPSGSLVLPPEELWVKPHEVDRAAAVLR